ncbi:MAG: hypothetical protein ACYDEV_04360 [Acidiferrobacter sp.]
MSTPYENKILSMAEGYDPRHIEAYIRTEHTILSRLTPDEFAAEVQLAIECIQEGGVDLAERIAQSFGL